MKMETYISVLKAIETLEKQLKEYTQGDEVASELLRIEISRS